MKVSILIPCYNSQDTITTLVNKLVKRSEKGWSVGQIILVNDGSKDKTHEKILTLVKRWPKKITYVNLFRNFGEHHAVICGLNFVAGDCVVIMDDDFQNPPSEVGKLVRKLAKGYDVVYSYYPRKEHSVFRNFGSKVNNFFASILLQKPYELYLSSFKAIDAKLVNIITEYKGPYPYIDGLILRSTQNIGTQRCSHSKRDVGESNYTIGKLVKLWSNMLTGFSVLPLRLTSYLGLVVSGFSLMLTVYFVLVRTFGPILIKHEIPPGWASTIVAITFLAGLQLIMLGMIGEYLGRMFLTMNKTPQYLVRDIYGKKSK